MRTTAEVQVAEPQVLETVVMEPQADVAIATAGEAPIAPVYDNEALKAIVQKAFQAAADPTSMVTDAVINRIISRIQGYIPSDEREFYQKVLGSNSFQSHLQSVVRRHLADGDFRRKMQEQVDAYLEGDALDLVKSLTSIELESAIRRITGSAHLESYRSRLTSDLERIAAEMRQEENAAALLATAVSPLLNGLAKTHLQAEAGTSIEAVNQRIKRLAAREKAVGILGERLPIRQVFQDQSISRYYINGLDAHQLPDNLLGLYQYLERFQLFQELATPLQRAPAGNWLNFGHASMAFEHLVYLMQTPLNNGRNDWPLSSCNGRVGSLNFLRFASDVMSILDALFGSKSMSTAHWCATPIVQHVTNRTRLGLHLLSYGVRVSQARGEAVYVRNSEFRPLPNNSDFKFTSIHILDE